MSHHNQRFMLKKTPLSNGMNLQRSRIVYNATDAEDARDQAKHVAAVFVCCVNRTPTQTACTDAHSVSQRILNRMITVHHANARGSRMHISVSQKWLSSTCHVSFLAAPDTDHKHKFSITYLTNLSRRFVPSHPSPLAHDPHFHCEDPQQSGGSTHIPYLTRSGVQCSLSIQLVWASVRTLADCPASLSCDFWNATENQLHRRGLSNMNRTKDHLGTRPVNRRVPGTTPLTTEFLAYSFRQSNSRIQHVKTGSRS